MALTRVIFTFISVAALTQMTAAQVPFMGKCPTQAAFQPFNVTQYLGQWYEQAKYFAIFQAGGKCTTAIYTDEGAGVVGVSNAQVNSITGSPSVIKGTATFSGAPTEAKLTVRFPSVGNMPAPYWVLDTDYFSYAIVWACTDVFSVVNTQFMWILTREKNPSPEFVTRIQNIVKSKNLNTSALKATEQNCT